MSQPPYDPNVTPPRRPTSPWAIVGIVLASCAGVALILVAVLAALLFPVFSKARDSARAASCLSNVKQLGVALAMYTQDYDEKFPPAGTWQDGLHGYVPELGDSSIFQCPSRPTVDTGYAFNRQLSEKSYGKITSLNTTPALFESSLGTRNGSDALESFITPHAGQGVVAFADGSAKRLEQAPPAGNSGG